MIRQGLPLYHAGPASDPRVPGGEVDVKPGWPCRLLRASDVRCAENDSARGTDPVIAGAISAAQDVAAETPENLCSQRLEPAQNPSLPGPAGASGQAGPSAPWIAGDQTLQQNRKPGGMHPLRGLIWGTLLAALLGPAPALAEDTGPKLSSELDRAFGLHANVFSNLGEGTWVSELSVPDRARQIALVGLIRIGGSGKEGKEDPVDFRSGSLTGPSLEQGSFTNPATFADLADLVLPRGDFEVLATCKPNQCKFKLSAESIQKVMSIDWKTDRSNGEFTEYFRQYLADYVQKYRKQGSSSLIVYDDKPTAFALREASEIILRQMTLMQSLEPRLFAYLGEYPQGRPPHVEDHFAWSLADFGYRPTLTVDHIIVDRSPQTPGVTAIFIMQTLYADHYLAARYLSGARLDGKAALGVSGRYLLLVDRMLFDDSLGALKRSLLGKSMKSDMVSRLEHIATNGVH